MATFRLLQLGDLLKSGAVFARIPGALRAALGPWFADHVRVWTPHLGSIGALLAAGVLLSTCGGQTYSCGTPNANHCYGTVTWQGPATGVQMELTPVGLTSGDIFTDDETWLIDYYAPGAAISGAYWVETGEWNDGWGTDYFWAENKANYGFMNYDLGPLPLTGPGNISNDWIAYKIDQDATTSTSWDVTIWDATTGAPIYQEQSQNNPMTPNTVIEGEELAGTQDAAGIAFFSQNAGINNGVTTLRTADGTIEADDPPHAGWFGTNNAPSQTTNGGLFFTECCNH